MPLLLLLLSRLSRLSLLWPFQVSSLPLFLLLFQLLSQTSLKHIRTHGVSVKDQVVRALLHNRAYVQTHALNRGTSSFAPSSPLAGFPSRDDCPALASAGTYSHPSPPAHDLGHVDALLLSSNTYSVLSRRTTTTPETRRTIS